MGTPIVVQPVPPAYPHRDLGTALLIIGFLMCAGGGYAATYCSLTLLGACVDYPYQSGGYALVGLGILLAVLGLFLIFQKETPPLVVSTQPGATLQPQPLFVQPMAYVQTVPVAPASPPAERYCPVCGAGNTRASAFCTKCGKPLPPPL